jgi:hypothetical protein
MNLPKLPAETSTFLWGAFLGAVALAFIGFTWGGWVSGGTAEKQAASRAEAAVVAALSPICVAQFKSGPKAQASMAALQQTDSWKQGDYVSKGGWATMPGTTEPNAQVAFACAAALTQ